MIKNEIKIIKKILNHVTKNGKKIKSEKIMLQSIKELQKPFKKQSKKVIQLALILSNPIFKLFIITQKKRKKKKDKVIPAFITKFSTRMSLAIKSIVKETRSSKIPYFYKALKEKIIETNNLESTVINIKNENHKKILLNKRLFKYYK